MNKAFHSFAESLVKYRFWLYLLYCNIVLNADAYFDLWVYALTFLLSVSITIVSYKYNTNNLRTFSDYFLIGVGVFKSALHSECYILILFPLICSSFNRGKHYGYFDIITFTVITLFLNYYPSKIPFSLLFPILIFLIISTLYANRQKWNNLEIKLSQIIDRYFAKSSPDKPHHILKEILIGFNKFFKENFLLKKSTINGIYVYSKTDKGRWFLRSSSEFLWTRNVNNRTNLNHQNLDYNRFVWDYQDNQRCVFYCINIDDEQFLFEIDINSSLPASIVFTASFRRVLLSMGTKFAHILIIDTRIKNYRNKKFTEIRNNIDYVNKAVNIMHFLRNRLSSIANLIVYDNLPDDKKTLSSALYKQQCKQADRDIEDIKSTAESLLDESHNPFKSKDAESKISLEKIYGILGEYALNYLDQEIQIDSDKYPVGKYFINGQLLSYKMIFVDWLTNMSKYKDKFCEVSFSVLNNKVIIRFLNDTSQETNLPYVIKAINNKKIDTVLKKNTHGLASIKEYATGLGITLTAATESKEGFDNNILCITMEIPIYGNN